MNEICYEPIGIINSPNKNGKGTPIQPRGAKNITGKVTVYDKYKEGLKDLYGFSHIILIYHFHRSKEYSLSSKPYMDDKKHGVFAMRGPSRPNSIGFSVVELLKIENNNLFIKNLDILDGTPVLDIKPYVPQFDIYEVSKYGWLENVVHKLDNTEDDGRFID